MNKYLIVLLFTSTLYLIGCEKPDIITFSDNKPVYLEGYLEVGEFATIHVSPTYDIIETSHPWIQPISADSAQRFYQQNQLQAILFKDGLKVDSLTGPIDEGTNTWAGGEVSPGWWKLKGMVHRIEPGGHYRMEIKMKSHPTMVAECIVPDKIENFKIDTIGISDYGYFEGRNYIRIAKNYMFNLIFSDRTDQKNYYMVECYYIDRNSNFHISKWWNLGSFSNPLFENSRAILAGYPVYPGGFFNDQLFNGLQQKIRIDPMYGTFCDSLICIKLVNISEGYYKRLKSTYLFDKNISNPYAEPVQVYSNFSNAVGFLAGRCVSSDTIKVQTFPSP